MGRVYQMETEIILEKLKEIRDLMSQRLFAKAKLELIIIINTIDEAQIKLCSGK